MGRKGSQRAVGARGRRTKEEVAKSLELPAPAAQSVEERLEVARKSDLAAKAKKHLPLAIKTLVDVMKNSMTSGSRVAAARAMIAYAYPESSAEGGSALGGARIQVNILRLSNGKTERVEIQREFSDTMKALLGRNAESTEDYDDGEGELDG